MSAVPNRRERALSVANTADASGSPHGTRGRYDAGCHCVECRAANAVDQQRKRARMRRRAVERAEAYLAAHPAEPVLAFPELMGASEAGDVLGTGREGIYKLEGVPEPVARLRQGSVWLGAEIRAYHAARPRRAS